MILIVYLFNSLHFTTFPNVPSPKVARILSGRGQEQKKIIYKTDVIHNPLGQTYCPASIDHYFYLKIVVLLNFVKMKRTDFAKK